MKHRLSGLASLVFFGLGLPLLVSGCGPRLTDPHTMWDQLLKEKGVTNVSFVNIRYTTKIGYSVTAYAIDPSAHEVSYNINSKGEISEQPDHTWDEWHSKINLAVDQVDFDGLADRVPAKDDPRPGCDEFRAAELTVLPTRKMASWTSCSSLGYNAGTLLVDGKPVSDQADPRDPAQVVAMTESYNDVFGAGTSVKWQAGLREGESTYVDAIPFTDDQGCRVSFFSSSNLSSSPLGKLPCSYLGNEDDGVVPFDLSRFSPTLVADIVSRLEAGGVKVSAVAAIIFTGTPEGNLKWQVSTDNISDALEHRELMQGELAPIN